MFFIVVVDDDARAIGDEISTKEAAAAVHEVDKNKNLLLLLIKRHKRMRMLVVLEIVLIGKMVDMDDFMILEQVSMCRTLFLEARSSDS